MKNHDNHEDTDRKDGHQGKEIDKPSQIHQGWGNRRRRRRLDIGISEHCDGGSESF